MGGTIVLLKGGGTGACRLSPPGAADDPCASVVDAPEGGTFVPATPGPEEDGPIDAVEFPNAGNGAPGSTAYFNVLHS